MAKRDVLHQETVLNPIFNNEIAFATLIELGRAKRKRFNELVCALKVGKTKIISSLNILEGEGFVEQNPSKNESKPFEKRRYKLRTKGAIYLQSIREKFPELSFNFFF
jgi:predicted transcriptional regulator